MFSQLGPFMGIAQMVQNGNPQKCVMVNATSNVVENIIVADPVVDPAPLGYLIVGIPDDSPVAIGWLYDPATGTFTDPNPPPPVVDPIP